MNDDMADEETRLNADNTTSNDDYTEADEGTIATGILQRRRAPAAVVAQDLLADPVVPFVLYFAADRSETTTWPRIYTITIFSRSKLTTNAEESVTTWRAR
eukprot:4316609-Pleurochrysis_carterae.AAC.2